jgi:hypothetical protein
MGGGNSCSSTYDSRSTSCSFTWVVPRGFHSRG